MYRMYQAPYMNAPPETMIDIPPSGGRGAVEPIIGGALEVAKGNPHD